MRPALALFQPDIAQNTGALIRLGACLDVAIHIIHPAGFELSDRKLRRVGMDYVGAAQLTEHISFEAFETWRHQQGRRLVLLTTAAETLHWQARFASGDMLLLGRETAGVPSTVTAAAEVSLRVPMAGPLRSLNVAMAGAIVLSEALRQTEGWTSLA
jgi:tRNA (cytidine/uridine-2'-O-)-methyltransferase